LAQVALVLLSKQQLVAVQAEAIHNSCLSLLLEAAVAAHTQEAD
jgi:hypothetical protein